MSRYDHWNYYCGITTDLTRMRKKLLDLRNAYDNWPQTAACRDANLDRQCKEFTICLFTIENLVSAAAEVAQELRRRHEAGEYISNETLREIPEAAILLAAKEQGENQNKNQKAVSYEADWENAIRKAAAGSERVQKILRSVQAFAQHIEASARRLTDHTWGKRGKGASDAQIAEFLLQSEDWCYLCDLSVNSQEWDRLQALNDLLPASRREMGL